MGVKTAMKNGVRHDFSKFQPKLPVPDLLAIQLASWESFLQEDVLPEKRENKGLEAVFKNMFLHLRSLDDNSLSTTWVDSPAGGKFTLSTEYLQMIWEMNQHGGQMAYVRGMQKGIEDPTRRSLIWDEARKQR